MLQKFYKIWWRKGTRVSNGVGAKHIRRQFSSACTIPSCYLLCICHKTIALLKGLASSHNRKLSFSASANLMAQKPLIDHVSGYMCSDGEKLFATHTNTTCGAGSVIHSPPLNETTTAAQATVGESSVTEPHVAVAEQALNKPREASCFSNLYEEFPAFYEV